MLVKSIIFRAILDFRAWWKSVSEKKKADNYGVYQSISHGFRYNLPSSESKHPKTFGELSLMYWGAMRYVSNLMYKEDLRKVRTKQTYFLEQK